MEASTPIQNEDLYKLLSVSEDATEKEITKAYRTAALKVHPDKNPDDPLAAHKFRRLSEALQLLTDVAARAAYDRVRRARQAAAERARALGEGRRRFKEQLDAAEAAAAVTASGGRRQEDEARLEQEMRRLRRDWDDVIAREQERLRRNMAEAAEAAAASKTAPQEEVPPTLKLSWRGGDDSANQTQPTEASLMSLCSAHGEVTSLLVRPAKQRRGGGGGGGIAVVEFRSREAAACMVEASAAGRLPDGVTAVWLQGERPSATASIPAPVAASTAPTPPPSTDSLRRMESDVLARMMAHSCKRPHPAAGKAGECVAAGDTTAVTDSSSS